MTAPRLASGSALLLALVACQPAEAPAGGGEELAAVSSRLDATEQRLAAIDAKLDALTTKLDQTATSLAPVAEWAAARKVRDDEREARRLEREARRLEREAFPLDDEGLPPVPTEGRALEGAADAIHCQGLETDRIECEVDRAFVDGILANPALLAKQARIVPAVRDGSTHGYKFYGIRPDSLPKLVGMKNGDLLTSANGERLDSIDDAMKLYTRLRGTTRLELGLERKGKPMMLVVEIVE